MPYIRLRKKFDKREDAETFADNMASKGHNVSVDAVEWDTEDQQWHVVYEKLVGKRCYLVKHRSMKDDETDEPLYWSNRIGWVDRKSATRFDKKQRMNDAINVNCGDD